MNGGHNGVDKQEFDLVRVICTAPLHGDRSFRVLCLMELTPLEAGGYTFRERGTSSAVMTRVKRSLAVRETGHGAWTYRFLCNGGRGCGYDAQRHEDELLEIVAALFRHERDKDPGATRVDLPIARLLSGYSGKMSGPSPDLP
jgi:hypothetical protein